jgi:hypothetical protein
MDSSKLKSQVSVKYASAASADILTQSLTPAVKSDEVLMKMIDTLRESNQLSLREVAVREREKAIIEREKQVLGAQTKRIHSDIFDQQDNELATIEAKEKEHGWIVREKKLQDEIEILKASLFKLQNGSQKGDASERKFPIPTEDSAEVNDGDRNEKSEMVTISRVEFEQMKKEM